MEKDKKRKLMLIGGGGHCHSVLDCAMSLHIYDEIAIIDPLDNSYLGIVTIGSDEDIPELIDQGWTDAFITVGSVGDTRIRRKVYEQLKRYDIRIPSIIDPSAVIGRGVDIGEGVFVGKRAIINTGSYLGACSIINTGAIIEHDCRIGEFSHISPGTTLCGQVIVGSDCHVGAGSVVKQLIEIGNGTLIGAGSIVVKNLSNDVKAFGNPCKVVK